MKFTRWRGWGPGCCTCFLGELGHSGQHRGVPGLKEIDHEQGQGVVIEKGAAPWVNNQQSIRLEVLPIPSELAFPNPAPLLLCPKANSAPGLSSLSPDSPRPWAQQRTVYTRGRTRSSSSEQRLRKRELCRASLGRRGDKDVRAQEPSGPTAPPAVTPDLH